MNTQQTNPAAPDAFAGAAANQAMGSDYYDTVYASSERYTQDYRDMSYYPMWAQAIHTVRSLGNPSILEVGCGVGHLAEYLHDEGFTKYHGFDFSEQAVAMAKKRTDQDFAVADAYDPASYDYDYDVAITLEVLEHLDDDLGVLRQLKAGSYVIFSLPTFDDPAHVRFFTNPGQIIQRYQPLVDFKALGLMLRWFIGVGVIRG